MSLFLLFLFGSLVVIEGNLLFIKVVLIECGFEMYVLFDFDDDNVVF